MPIVSKSFLGTRSSSKKNLFYWIKLFLIYRESPKFHSMEEKLWATTGAVKVSEAFWKINFFEYKSEQVLLKLQQIPKRFLRGFH